MSEPEYEVVVSAEQQQHAGVDHADTLDAAFHLAMLYWLQSDFAKARSNVDDVLAASPEINCMVGFYSYNPPKIYEALKAANKLGQITVIAFDEDPITLGAVREGSFAGTVVQQPFEWGYQGMKLMAAYLEGDKSKIPTDKLIIVPTKVIDKANVDQFETNLKATLGKK